LSRPFNEARYKTLLDGLEVTEIKLSEALKDNQYGRIDSDYFRKEFIQFFSMVKNWKPLGEFVQDGYRVVYETTEIINAELAKQNDAPMFLQASDLQTPFVNKENIFYVDEADWIRYPKGRIKPGELLIEVKGKAEKVSIVPDDFPTKVLVSGSLYKLTPKAINKYYLVAYLISKYGQGFKDRAKTNLLISFISKDDMYKIPVPVFSDGFQSSIEKLFKKAYKAREQSKRLYAQAEATLLDELGLKNWSPPKESAAVKSFSESFGKSGRLDAEFYQPKYDALLRSINKSGYPVEKLGSLVEPIKNGFDSREYTEEGTPYIRVGDVRGGRIDFESAVKIPVEMSEIGKDVALKLGDVLFTRKGTFGNAAVAREDSLNAVISSEIMLLRLLPEKLKAILPDYLALYLNSDLGYLQVERRVHGVAYYSISQPDLATVEIAIPPMPVQVRIAKGIQNSLSALQESKRLLEVSKRAVESAIEKGEKSGMRMLE
jgi:restriction endonuclease S subunit